jgi:glycosyltransferase involved in cell wall biosynthesis
MPVFNERYGNEIFIDEIRKNFDRHSVRILIVDDASTDGTYEMLKNKIGPVIMRPKKLMIHQSSDKDLESELISMDFS